MPSGKTEKVIPSTTPHVRLTHSTPPHEVKDGRDGRERFPLIWSLAAGTAHAAALALYIPINLTARFVALIGGFSSHAELVTPTPNLPERWNVQVSHLAETDTLSIGDRDTADVTVVVVPGNPGHSLFYTAFMQRLYDQAAQADIKKKVCVVAFSHLGHSPAATAKPCSYIEQSEHAAGVVASLQQSNPTSEYVLVGHSIGARLCLDMLSHRGDTAGWDESRITQAILLFPTVSYIGYSHNGMLDFPFMRCHTAMSTLFDAIRPAMRLSWLEPAAQLKLGKSAPPHGVRALCEMFASTCAGSQLYMGLTEMEDVLAAPTLSPAAQSKLVWYIGGECEKWVIRSDIAHLETQFPHSQINHCQQEIPHAFVLSDNDKVADMTWKWIGKALSQ
jgi:pimeloyl-ACP methyl ester carboxylesterase